MKKIKIIIGANFGDEGKGLITAYNANKFKNGIVVRFNGGSQASHTVELSDGRRHAFSHFGSGSFYGLPTYLNKDFITNPIMFNKEKEILSSLNALQSVYISPDSIVTTPYDMIINQLAESNRGEFKHGSCGLGINETVVRNLAGFKLTMMDLKLIDIREILEKIRDEYVPKRLEQLKIIPNEKFSNLLKSSTLIDRYIEDTIEMVNNVNLNSPLNNFKEIIFEGAQGLMLDEEYKYFPHVTRSKTGINNALEELKLLKDKALDIEVIYATRAYMTRHGAGPFESEVNEKPYSKIEDKTNVPNEFQDSLRYGLLDVTLLNENINNDIKTSKSINVKKSLFVSCLDQLDNEAKYIVNNNTIKSNKDEFLRTIKEIIKPYKLYTSYSPTINEINEEKQS